MPNKVVNRTQVPVEPKDVYFEVGPSFDGDGVYVRHEVRVLYQPHDDQGVPIGPRQDVPNIPLTAPQRTALASFIATIAGHANTREGT